MLLKTDRVTEPVDDLADKLRRYTDWFHLPAPKADPDRERTARGVAVHCLRLGRSRSPAGRPRSARAGSGAWSTPPTPYFAGVRRPGQHGRRA
ncbi:hypothetical protein GTW66_24840 [Streptomyces sp. SID5473]|uniref:Uncharacterized protein n=1 Tax=Streptomyces tsukubensis (strain DSM 42081 / NBRC 108919 / NRRL 18488 / 9993) TaxID=1114943 RepID=I2NC04_STRT9|nr:MULTISPECIES: hypothetical protein [Streptomyces]EIF94551.1 hypothetical protein [Streptomyces tsukubensis NRRL18488]MYS67119.1 hypothetical protein [Streptomyces sp. SID5473]QKM65833.1 hypothetical protein STSU_000310 [Streptomyces tsukubensis NRRL18488]TAI40864.1 hypothetical protein EWI31_29735 [Streptomyces tsukubensis]